MSTFATVSEVTMEPSWRGEDVGRSYSFFVTAEEADRDRFAAACAEAQASGLKNTRVFTPAMLDWASIFHPAFFAAMSRHHPQHFQGLRLCLPTSPGLRVADPSYWIQSMLFLAGVTLSAALIQNRFSPGTLASKLDRLWQVGAVAEDGGIESLTTLKLRDRVLDFAQRLDRPEELLLDLKDCFSEALAAMAHSIPVETEELREVQLTGEMSDRLGFRSDLSAAIGTKMQCMIVYGSSVNSPTFADYDVIVVTPNRNDALRSLRRLAPAYRGVELNISVFEPEEFWNYQTISGDNLSHHGLCIFGEAIVPKKSEADLLARNYSFGFIRLRQILGMCAAANSDEGGDDSRANLYGYFAKIPLNVARGILGAKGITVTKEELLAWASSSLNYSPGRIAPDMAAAAWATHRTMSHFNNHYCICTRAD
jgi:hypothetical protein